MAFNASSILSRYSAAGKVKVQKVDVTKLATDLVNLETFAATNASNAGKFNQIQLAEVTATPATNIQLFHINTSGYASTTNLGQWKKLIVDETITPATNLELFHVLTNGYASSSVAGMWTRAFLDNSVNPGTNIGWSDLTQAQGVFNISGAQSFPGVGSDGFTPYDSIAASSVGMTPTTTPFATLPTAVPFYLTTSTIGTDDGTYKFWRVASNGRSDLLFSGDTFGGLCKVTCVQISGVRTHNATFIFFGTLASHGAGFKLTYAVDARIYQIGE